MKKPLLLSALLTSFVAVSLASTFASQKMESFGQSVFKYCAALTDVYCFAEEPPAANNNIFEGSNIATSTLHVPATSLNAYNTTSPWSSFGTIVPLTDEETTIEEINANDNLNSNRIYDLSGREVTKPTRGIYIKDGKKMIAK